MALTQSITVADNGAAFDQAYGRIDRILIVDQSLTKVTIGWYVNSTIAAAGTFKPIRSDEVTIPTPSVLANNPLFVTFLAQQAQQGRIQSPLDALKSALYWMLQQTPAYSSALSV